MKTHRGLVCLMLIAGALSVAGCGAQNPFTPPPAGGGGGGGGGGGTAGTGKPGTAPAPNATGNGVEMSLTSKIKKKIDFIDWQNEMRQIAQYYRMFELDKNRSPKTVKELQDFIGNDGAQLVKWINDGHYVVIPNVKPSTHTILAYQNKDLRFGSRYVVLGDGSFHEWPEQEFQTALKQQGN